MEGSRVELLVALATAFYPDGALDVDATLRLAEHMRDTGVGGFVIGGTTGEGAYLADEELRDLGLALRSQLGSDATVAVGCIRPDADAALRSVEALLDAGPDAVLVPPPAGSDEAQISDFYLTLNELVADRAQVWAYHWPARYPPGIGRTLWPTLAVDAFKDSTGDIDALSALSQDVRERVYIGAAALSFEATRLGCRGVILAAANVAPEAAVQALAGDATALERLMQGDRDLKSEFPASLKRLVAGRVQFPLGTRAG